MLAIRRQPVVRQTGSALSYIIPKWFDLPALLAKVLQPHHEMLKVKYFAARVSGTPADLSKPQRLDVHLRALRRHRPEEEGSDVDLAVHLLNGGWLEAYDCTELVSSDSDIAEGMRLDETAPREADRASDAGFRKAIASAHGARRLLSAHQAERVAAVTASKSRSRHQYRKARGLVVGSPQPPWDGFT